MEEVAKAAFQYLSDHLLATIVNAFLAGFAGIKSVALAKQGNVILYFIVGLLGTFIGQFGVLYFGLREIFDMLPILFRLFFDLLAAYIGAFLIAAVINFVKPT